MMNDRRKSDRPVVVAKRSNKAGEPGEKVERRGLAKRKTPRQNTDGTKGLDALKQFFHLLVGFAISVTPKGISQVAPRLPGRNEKSFRTPFISLPLSSSW
jgi:hypothetical protein